MQIYVQDSCHRTHIEKRKRNTSVQRSPQICWLYHMSFHVVAYPSWSMNPLRMWYYPVVQTWTEAWFRDLISSPWSNRLAFMVAKRLSGFRTLWESGSDCMVHTPYGWGGISWIPNKSGERRAAFRTPLVIGLELVFSQLSYWLPKPSQFDGQR